MARSVSPQSCGPHGHSCQRSPGFALILLACALTRLAEAQVVGLDLIEGVNLVALPPSAAATSAYGAAALARDTGAAFFFVPAGRRQAPRVYLPEFGTPDFQFDAAFPVLLPSTRTGRALLRVPPALPSLGPVPLELERSAGAPLALPLLAGARAALDAGRLARLTAARYVTRTAVDPATGRARFETFVADGSAGFPLEAHRGYLLGLPAGGSTTSLPVHEDLDSDGLPDDLQASLGLTGGRGGDADGDGLSNGVELSLGTNPTRGDTDGDGVSDPFELARDFDPRDPASRPPAPRVFLCQPSSVQNDAAAVLTIAGAAFTGAFEVTLRGPPTVALQAVLVVSDASVTATLPAGTAAGQYGLIVRSPAGASGGVETLLTVTSPPPPPPKASFARDVFPIFGQRCSGCHFQGSSNGAWASSTPAASLAAIRSRGVAVAFQPSRSPLLLRPIGEIPMPGAPILSRTGSEFLTIERWIVEGALDN